MSVLPGVMLFRMSLIALIAIPMVSFAASIDVTRRGFLIGTGATVVTAVAPKIIVPPQPLVYEFVWQDLSHYVPSSSERAIIKHVMGAPDLFAIPPRPGLSDAEIVRRLEAARVEMEAYARFPGRNSRVEARGLILERKWEPVALQENTGRWFDGFARALSRKSFRILSDLMEVKKGAVTQQELRQIVADDESVCDANLNTPILNKPVYIQEDEN